MRQSIELDCPPGYPRPGDLIDGVLEGTGLKPGETVSRLFGNWIWEFPDITEDEWKTRIRPIIKPRIVALYEAGVIRWGSW